MTTPVIDDLKIFVPAKDYAVSRSFYLALGGRLVWEIQGMAEIAWGGVRFLLQDFYVKDWAENFVMHLPVADAAAWHVHLEAMIAEGAYPGIRARPPKTEPWGATVTYAWDPSGVLLQFAQETEGK